MKRIFLFLLLFPLSVIFSGCQKKPADYYTIKPVDINYRILASCSVKYPKPLDMTAPSSGKVLRVNVNDGSAIRKGQLLVQMDDFNERQNLEISTKNLASTQLKIKNAREEELPKLHEQEKQAKSDLEIEKNNLERSKKLFDAGDIARVEFENSQNKYDRALSAYNQVHLTLDSYEKSGNIADLSQQVSVQQAQIELARKALQDRKFIAPFDGTVSKVYIQPGESVQAGTTVLTVIEKGNWVLEADVDQKDLPYLLTNQSASIAFDAYPQEHIQAGIIYVCTLIDAQKGTCNLKLEILKNKPFIKYGMSGTAEINGGIYQQKLAIPSRFAERLDGGLFVWKWNGRSAEHLKLDYEQLGEQWVITKNLSAGTKILLPGKGVSEKSPIGKEVIVK